MTLRPDFYARYKGVSNVEFSPFDLKQSFIYDARLSRERRDIFSALFGAIIVDTHSELGAAWRAIIRRGHRPSDLAELGRVPLTEKAMLDLAKSQWKDAAFRNRQKLEWQRWAQQKYRALAGSGKSENQILKSGVNLNSEFQTVSAEPAGLSASRWCESTSVTDSEPRPSFGFWVLGSGFSLNARFRP